MLYFLTILANKVNFQSVKILPSADGIVDIDSRTGCAGSVAVSMQRVQVLHSTLHNKSKNVSYPQRIP